MSPILAIVSGAVSCVLAALLAAALITGLRWLAHCHGGRHGERLLHGICFALIGALLGAGLPLLWPALAAWYALVLGASLGLVWAAMQPGMPSRRRAADTTDAGNTP